jgi:hypothetical protein
LDANKKLPDSDRQSLKNARILTLRTDRRLIEELAKQFTATDLHGTAEQSAKSSCFGDAARREKSSEPWASREPVDDERGADAFDRLARLRPDFFAGSTLVSGRCSRLSFY